MDKYKIHRWFTEGDNSESEKEELLKLLNEGWEIISAVPDDFAIVYILKNNLCKN